MARLLLACLLLFLAAAPARSEWRRAESPNFVVHSEEGEEALRARVQRLEEFDRLLRLLTGLKTPPSANKLHLYIVNGFGQFVNIWGVSGAAGFYSASPAGIAAVVDQDWRQDYMTYEEVLLHEYAHHFMLQYFPAAYPSWYVEGFAEYVMTTRFGADSIEFGRFNEARASWLADRSAWVPLDRILFGDPTKLSGEEVARFYAQSWLIVHYLMRDQDRRRRLTLYLDGLRRGDEPRRAYAAAFEMDPSRLQRAISRYGGDAMTYSRMPRISAADAPPIQVRSLGELSDDLVLAQAAIDIIDEKQADRLLRRVRDAARGREDPVARRVLARAEALYGDGVAADRLLDPLLAAAPGDADLLYLKGTRYLAAGRRDPGRRAALFRSAQSWFARAHKADENHFPTLYRYAESLSLEPGFPTENTLNVMRLALQIAPQVREIAFSTANMLMRRGEFEEAEALLAPVATSRHGGELGKAAGALLAKARARDNKMLPDPFLIPEEKN